ncbi:MAG: KGG domain-containing protein [Pseudobdellovibrionaceae bacterium]
MANQDRNQGTSKRGFASMDKEQQREIAKKGGEASHGGRESRESSESRSEAGRKGGKSSKGK